MSKPKPYFAIISGLCASSASFFGKLSSLGQEIAENAGYKQVTFFQQGFSFANSQSSEIFQPGVKNIGLFSKYAVIENNPVLDKFQSNLTVLHTY